MNKLSMLAAVMLLASHSAVAAMGPFEIYEQALRNDPVFLGAIKERDAGLENRAIGRAGLLPRIGYTYNKGRNSSKATSLDDRARNRTDIAEIDGSDDDENNVVENGAESDALAIAFTHCFLTPEHDRAAIA